MTVRCVLTAAAQRVRDAAHRQRAVASKSARAYTDLFDPQSEFDAGHIRLGHDCAADRRWRRPPPT
ncbi:MAG: hypothetical protein MZV49_20840 [Rhodopseudomonas palustris]|nr:hypothetical protein [Rhodopseudomonas palustris]